MVWKVEICVVQLLHRAYHILGNTIGLKLVILLVVHTFRTNCSLTCRRLDQNSMIQTPYNHTDMHDATIILSQPHLLLSTCLLSLLIVWRWSWMPREFYCVFLACIYSTNAKKSARIEVIMYWGVYNRRFSRVWKVMTLATHEWSSVCHALNIHHLSVIHEKIRIVCLHSI
jgi:hypothetical protein